MNNDALCNELEKIRLTMDPKIKNSVEFNIGVALAMVKGQIHVLKSDDKVLHAVTIDTLKEVIDYLESAQECLRFYTG